MNNPDACRETERAYFAQCTGSCREALLLTLEKRKYSTLYFNAYKYSSYMEVVPALIYKIIDALPISNDAAASKRLIQIMGTLAGKYSERFGNWIESRVGLNPVSVAKDVASVKELWNAPEQERQEVLKAYYTRVDRAQDTLVQVFKGSKLDKSMVVLIDELNRAILARLSRP